jgi:hypothetical protein
MENRDKNKWKVRGAILAIFLLGFLAGTLALNVYNNYTGGGRTPQPNGRQRIEQFFERLQLNEAQQTEVREIFNDARTQMQEMRRKNEEHRREMRRQTDERLQKVLTPEQWEQFQQMRNESGDRQRRRRPQNRE